MYKRYNPTSLYEKPKIEVIEIENTATLLQASQTGQGVLPPTENNNSDNDW